MSTLIQCQALSKAFGNVYALNNVNLNIESGHIIGLLGPNGSGKTTLIKLINGLLTPTSGLLEIKGKPVSAQSKKIVSYLPDQTYLNNWMRVRDIFHYFSDFYDDFDELRAYDMLSKLGIDSKAKLKTMSKGTKEKVQLILVMSRKADIYILDEPIAGVDPATRDYILHTILTNYDENASIIISTHLIADIENMLDEVIFIQNGSIVLNSTVDDLREKEGKSVDMVFREVFRC